jgi:hypothetical protein
MIVFLLLTASVFLNLYLFYALRTLKNKGRYNSDYGVDNSKPQSEPVSNNKPPID